MSGIDMHIHTTASDGSNAPAVVVRMAAEAGYQAIAITDHDNTNGVHEAQEAAKKYGLEVVPGIELSTQWNGTEVHILGYYVTPGAESLADLLGWALNQRNIRNTRIVEKLQEKHIPISMEEVRAKFPSTVLGRPHIGTILIEKGYATDMKDAFAKYLGKTGCCYVRRVNLPMEDAIRRIMQAGGLPVLAHPYQYELPEPKLRELISVVKENGGVGMECIYSKYDAAQSGHLLELAKEYDLLPTGGSDYHGKSKPNIQIGTTRAPYAYLEALKKAAGR